MAASTLRSLSLICAIALGASACTAEQTEDDGSEEMSEELKLCRPFTSPMPDRTRGEKPITGVEIAASLPYPPGNVAVAADGRMFVSFFPDTNHGPVKVGVMVNGAARPFPNAAFQDDLHAVLGIRMDRHGRLWVLDHGQHGIHRPKLFAFDVATSKKVHEITFDFDAAPIGSMLNDVQIAPDGNTLYISDSSYVGDRPGLLVVDLPSTRVRRVLDKHASVMRGKYDVVINGKRVRLSGVFCAGGGIDGIALDATGQTLYYAPLNSGTVFRVPTAILRDFSAPKADVARAVEKFVDASMTDGMVTDAAGNVYLTDMEHSQIVRVAPDRSIDVVARDPRLRWPDGFAWAADGSLYVSASALQLNLPQILPSKEHVAKSAPYHVLRIRNPGARPGVVGQ